MTRHMDRVFLGYDARNHAAAEGIESTDAYCPDLAETLVLSALTVTVGELAKAHSAEVVDQ